MTNAFAVEFEVLRSSVVPGDPETYSETLLIQQYWRKQAACCASTSSAAHCHVDLSWYKWHGDPQVSRESLAVLFGFVVRPWGSERVEAVGFQSFLCEQRARICFQSHQNTRAAQKIKLNGKCICHSDVCSYEMEFEVLRSFCPTRARRCHFCMGICYKSRDLDRIFD